MAHLAFTEGDTEWGDHLTDDEYPARRRRAQATRRSARRSTRPIVVRERGGQRAVCVDLGEQILGLVLDRRNCIGSCDEAERWSVEFGDRHERGGELGGIPTLLAVHAPPRTNARRFDSPQLHQAIGKMVQTIIFESAPFTLQ
jgi:hypothetical protein